MKLDSKDHQILYEMDVNCRQPINKIAKKIRLSKDTTLYRIKKLEKENILIRYQAYINHGKLGYMGARINFKLQNTTPEKEEEIIEFIKKQPSVGFFASVEGNIDLVVWILIKTVNELNKFWEMINEKYVNYIEKSEMGVYTKIEHYPRTFFVGSKKNSDVLVFTSVGKPERIDKTDLNILKILTKNARESLVSIAGKIKVSTKTVSSRIKNLEKRDIIRGYTTVFNMEKLGYIYYKIYFNFQNTTNQNLKKLYQFILEHPNIVYRDYVISGHSCEIEVQVKNEKELRNLIDEMKREFSSIIKSYEILHYFKEHKMLSMPWVD
ncbi:MAG: Lrp/AsnC family transcriptional regulator [Nanoarchaeota archaeon]|nr:Lrp/AsnC family transcriptional regulator [Nanoarchaeota archaeon]